MVLEPEHDPFEEVFLFPASFAQQRLWFLEQFFPSTALYNVPLVFRLSGQLHLEALRQTFDRIVNRHEILRTTFQLIEGQLHQVVVDSVEIALPLIDLREVSEIDREQEAERLIWQEMQRPFNLSMGALLRLLLLQLSETEFILQINLHHIIFDEWSSGILIRELSIIYSSLVSNEPVMLPELPIQYADFAHWQQQWLQGDVLEAQLGYWRQQLKDLPTLNFPTDHPRPALSHHQGATHLLELPQSLLNNLEELSQQTEVTLFMILLAAFQTLLHRYTGQTDLAVGSPIANRHRSEVESLIGFFVNSLVLRTDLSDNPTFRELLDRVRETTLAAYAHQDLPFEKLVEELQPDRDVSRNPLFQVVFALQNTPMQQLELSGIILSPVKFDLTTTRFDLEFYLWKHSDNFRNLWGKGWQHSEGLRGVLVYDTALFTAETIDQLAKHFHVLLQGIVANPDARLADLPLLTAIEQQQLQDWNNTQTQYPHNQCIHHIFETQVERTPDAIAVNFADRSFTYRELNQGSNQLARYLQKSLQKLAVSSEICIGICLEQSVEAVAAMLAILKVGATYVPLDPSYPSERLCFMVTDANVKIVLTCERWADQFRKYGVQVICLEQIWDTIAAENDSNLNQPVYSDNLAYIIYTSGSTGVPKGVAVPHRAVIRLVCDTNYVELTATDKVAQVSNLAFDAATFEIWGALLNGAQLVGIERNIMLTPEDFANQLQQQQISILFLTTALFNQIAREVPTAFHSLKYLLFGGESVDPKWVQQVLQKGAPEHLLHVYGPTENTTFSSYYPVQSLPESATTIPIGKPIANTQIYLLDQYLNPVPIGVVGEIYLGGEGLASNYLNHQELTDQCFIPNPFQANSKLKPKTSKLYKTGDLARYRPDGNLEFWGRIDHQIKLRGFRVELGEIEAVLKQHPLIQDAIVVVHQGLSDTLQNRRLVAYIIGHSTKLDQQQLRYFLKQKIPDYMIPVAFTWLDQFPMTANGKVDRQMLATAEIQSKTTRIATTPRSSVEAGLAEIWVKLLELPQVDIHDNFFELGGHSLLATQLVSRIRTQFQVELPLRILFEAPTIAELAQYIDTVYWTMQSQALSHSKADVKHQNLDQEVQLREEVEL